MKQSEIERKADDCNFCGAKVLKEIERRFLAIQKKEEKPDAYIEMPRQAFG